MTNMQETSADYEYKSLTGQFNIDEALGIVECFAAGVGNKDSVGDICLPGCFTNSLKRRKPRVVWGHNWNEPIGKVLEIYEVGPNDPRLPAKMRKAGVGGLYTRVQFNLKAERGREAFANVSFFGLEQEWSIGYKTLDAVFDPTQQANLLKEVELYEVSPVLHGANQLTGTISIKSDEQGGEVKGGPCWDGYRQEGMKKGKNGKMVPNCVPIEEKGAKLRDPNGGLTAAGRAHFKRTEGANLKPGVKGPADTPEKMRRKGSFLTRFFTNPSGPMKKPNGEPTRLALSASAWGEPVPKNAADAAELAAKGRRLLERYSNTKKKDDSNDSETKNHVTAIYEAMNNGENSVVGRAADLTRALASHFGGAVRLVNADNDIAIFEMGAGVSVETLRVSYYFDGDEFMFGTAQQVRPETVYIPTNNSNGSRMGDNGTPNAMIVSMGQTNGSLYDAMSSAAVPHEACCDDCSKGDTSCSIPNNLSTLDEFKSANIGEHLFLLPENNAEKIEAFEIINTIAEYHSFDVKVLENGIVVPNIDKVSVAAYKALSNFFDSFEQKALGAAIGKKPRNTNAFTARNADNDPYVLEGITTINRGRGVIDPTPGSDFNVPKKPKRTRRPGEADMPSVPEPVTIPEEIPEVQPVKPDVKPARPVIVPEKEPEKVPETVPEKEPEKVPERVPQREPERVPERVPRRQPERTPLPVEVPERVPQRVSGGPAGRMSTGRRFSQEQRPIDMDTAEKVFNAFNAVSKNKDTKKAYEQVARKFNISPRTVERYVNEIGKRSNRDLPYVKRPEEAGVVDVDSPRGAMSALPSSSNFSAREKRQMREEKLGRQIFLARDNDGISLNEAASQFSITREKARQLELRHMSKLRGMDENSPNRVTRRMLDDPSSTLTDAQTSLMKRRLDGETLQEAAERLGTDRQTVRRQEQIAMRKLQDSMVIDNGPVGSMTNAKWTESIGAAESVDDLKGRDSSPRSIGFSETLDTDSVKKPLPDGFTSEVFDLTGRKKSYLKQNNPDDPELDEYLPNIINSFLSNFSITGEPYSGNNSPDGPSGAIRAIDRIISNNNNEESSYPEKLMRNVYSSFGNSPIEQIAKDNDISRNDVVQIVKAQATILSATETPERSEIRYLMREHGYLLEGTDRDVLSQKLYGATNLDIAKDFNLKIEDVDSRLTKSMRTLRKADGSTSKPVSVSNTRYGIDDEGFFLEADASDGSLYKKYVGKTQLDNEIDDYFSDGPVGSMAIRQNNKTRIYANGDDGQVEEYDLTDDLSDGVSMQEKPYLRRVRGFNQPELHEILGRKLLAEDGETNYMVVETPEYSFVTNDEAQAMARAAERGVFLDDEMKPQGLFLNPDGTETLRSIDSSTSPREGSRIVSWNNKSGYDGEPSHFKISGEIFATADMSESWDEEEREARRLIRNKKVRRLESGPEEKFWTQNSWKWRYQGTSPDLIVTKDVDTPDFGPAVIEKIHTLRNSEQSAALREAADSKDKKDLTGAEKNYSVLGDMYFQYAKNGKLSDRQWSYAASLIDKFENNDGGYTLAPGEEAVLRVNRETGELLGADPEDGRRLVNAARTLEQDDADIEKLLYRYDIDGGLMPEQWDRMRTLTRQRMAESRASRQAGQSSPSQAAQTVGGRGTNIDKSEIGDDGKISSTYVNKLTGEVTKYRHKNVGVNSTGPVFLVAEDENGNLIKWNHPVSGDLFSYSDWPQEELGEIFDETVEKIRTQRGRHPATDGVMISAKPWDVEADIRGKAGENVTAQELKEEYEKLGLYGLGLNSSTPVIETDSEIILAKDFTESDIKKAITDARDSGLKISFEYLKPDADRPEKRTVTEPRYEERFGGDGKVISAYIVGIDEKDGKEKNFRTDRMYGRKSEKPKPEAETGERTETRRPGRESPGASRPRDNSTRRPRDEGAGERKPREEESGQRERTQPREEQEKPRERQTERQRTTADVVAKTISLRRGARERTLLISLDDNQGTIASTLATADRDVIDAEFPYGNKVYAVELVKFVKNTNGDVSLHATDKSDGQRKIFDPYMIAVRSTSEPIPTSLPYLLEDLSRKIGADRRGFAIASASDIAAYNRAKEKLARASRKNQINSFDTGPFGALGLNASRVPNYSPTDFWRPNKHDSTYSSMPESQRMAESKRLLSRITNSSNRNDSQLDDVLDRYAALERINKTANGPYIDEFGASITRLKNNEYEISGNIPFDPEMNSSPFGKMGRYVRPRNTEERNIDNLYNIQIYNELTELISSVPEGQAISQLAQRHSTSQQNIRRRLNVVDRERANEIRSFDSIDEITSQLESGEIDYNELEMRLDDEMSQRELVKNIDYAYREMNFSYDDSGPVGAMSGKNASEMSDDELVDAWNDAMEKLFGSYGRPHRKDRAAKSALMKELKSVGREIQKRYFDSEDAKSAIREIQQNPPQGPVGSMSSGSMPNVPISGSKHVDRRLYEVYGDDKWKIVAEQIGKRFSTIEQRDWDNPTDDDLIDIHHYLNQRIFDSQISGEDFGDIEGMPYDILSVAGDLDISANQVVDYAQKGREIAEARMASLMTPFERAERMIVNDRRKTFERLLSRKRKELGDGFDDWFQSATERNKNTLYDENGNDRPIEQIEDLGGPYAGYFYDGENTTEPDADIDTAREIEELNKLFNSPTYNPEEGGSGPAGSMGRRFVPQRYDIKPTEDGKWVIIDTANRNAPVSRSFDSRLEALDGAKRMDRNDTTFNPFSPARISSQNPPQRQEPEQNPVIESGIYENEQPELPFSDGPAGGMRKIPGSRYSSNDPVRRNGARVTKGNAEAAINAYEDGDAMLPYGGAEDATEYVLFSGWTAADSALDTIIGRLEYLAKMRTHAGNERDKKKAEVRKLVSYLPKLQKRRKWFYLQLRKQMLEKRDVDGVLQFDEMDRLRSGASLEDQTMLNSSNFPRYNIPGITVPRDRD
jgi:HK97 family phage prohead protease